MITSLENTRVKSWKKLHQRKNRYESGKFLIEGFHVVEEAWKSGWELEEIILKQGVSLPEEWEIHKVTMVNSAVFKQVSQTENAQGIMAVVAMEPHRSQTGNRRIVATDSLQDPGNLGTIIRTADAAGYDAVLLGEGTVDLYNEKVIRASQGSIFHIPVIQVNLINHLLELKAHGIQIMTSTLENASAYHEMEIPEKMALIVGNEGSGIREDVIALSDVNVRIPIYGEAESLNVSIAAGILMYHFNQPNGCK